MNADREAGARVPMVLAGPPVPALILRTRPGRVGEQEVEAEF